ncbi:MAG: RNA polymerase sigma factor [Candidatus Portnoybacteria bacterium]|nr:RNA polymerase sigma factor [Candidatus Portnoybacteria bacterium]
MRETQKTDEEIARFVQSGDIEAFGLLVKRYEAKLKRYGRRFLSGDQAGVEDVVQEAFLKAYENIRSFDSSKKFSPWLYRIAHNEFVNVLRKKKPLLFFGTDIFFPHPIAKEQADKEANFQETRKLIDKCLKGLDLKYKEPLILYYFEELDYKEIADILRIPISTVGVRLKRGKELIKNVCEKSNGTPYE